jgi:hypothetical protein
MKLVPLTDAVRRLALSAPQQVEYLRSIGTAPSTDELALEFDDLRHLGHPADAAPLVERIDGLLEAMSGPGPLWHVDALDVAPEWAELRLLAAELLRLLPFDGRPRPLAPSERAVLERVLAGTPALLAQLDHAQVLKPWYEGSASFDVMVQGPPADVPDGVLPVDAQVHVGGVFVGEILLWITGGLLSSVEYAWVTDEPPATLPPAENVTVRPG